MREQTGTIGKNISHLMLEYVHHSVGHNLPSVSYTHLIISELLSKGIDKDEIYRRVFNTYSESRLRLMGYVPVSYTHLDVYKRQLHLSAWNY